MNEHRAVAALGALAQETRLALYRLLSGLNALSEHANLRIPAALDRALGWLLVTPDRWSARCRWATW